MAHARFLRWTTAVALMLVMAAPAAHAQTTSTSVQLTWTAPGDDANVGTATQYDLRYSTSAITAANFASATRFTGTPAPAVAGTSQGVTVTGLAPATTYYFAIKTADDVGNWSTISNVVSKATPAAPDVIPPAAITASVSSVTDTSATLAWVATGNDSVTGTAASYDVRYSTSPITTANWSTATQTTGEPTPLVAGTAQSFVIHPLGREVTYYFAIKATDSAGNVSALSNVPSATTTDTVPPAAIQNLTANFMWLSWRSSNPLRARMGGAL